MNERLTVSVLIPAYKSSSTIALTLTSLRDQSISPIEVIVVDSSPDLLTEEIVRSQFPEVLYYHSPTRLWPHAARNQAVKLSRGEWIVFTDPDVIAPPNWLENLLQVRHERGGVVTGAVQCHGNSWTATGLHLSKFDKWLPGGTVRRIDIGPTVSLLISRSDFERVGNLDGEYMIGDTLYSWRLERIGIPLFFAPQAILEHEHTDSWIHLLRQSYSRGKEFGFARRRWHSWSLSRLLFMTAVSVTPVRLGKILLRVFRNSWRAGMAAKFVVTFPIIFTAHVSRMAGEITGYYTRNLNGCAS